jgi:hypothetical protein
MNKQELSKNNLWCNCNIIISLGILYAMKPNKPTKVLEPKSNFEVIDTYNGCAVVRYAAPNGANYHYFLDCQK